MRSELGGSHRTIVYTARVDFMPSPDSWFSPDSPLQFAQRVRHIALGPAQKNINVKHMEQVGQGPELGWVLRDY